MRFLIFLIPMFVFGYVDLGKSGVDYPILETNFLDDIKKGVEELDTEQMKRDFKVQLNIQATGEKNLGECYEEKTVKEFDYVELQEDIYTPMGRIYKEKGTKMTAYIAVPLDICFVDGTNKESLVKQIEFFDKQVKKCIYMVSNRNILEVYNMYPERNREMFPSKKVYEERFNVKCNPTRVHLIHNDRIKYQYPLDNFR